MTKISKTNVRKKTTKNIEKEQIVVIMKANINEKNNNPNFSKVFDLTGIDRKTLKRWWDNEKNTLLLDKKKVHQNLVHKSSKESIPKWKII